MKKRILGFILAVLLVLPTFMLMGCKKDQNSLNLTQNGAVPVTLTLYTITEAATTEEARQAVEDEINRITEYEFNTHVILRTFTAEEYKEAVLRDLEIAKKNYVEPEDVETDENGDTVTAALTTSKDTLAKKEPETDKNGETKHRVVINEEKVSYPAERGTQVDILLVTSYDDYNELIYDEHIQALNAELDSTGALIKKYIHPTLLDAANTMTGIYGIPNNKLIGEYEYILLRKDLVDKYSYDPASLNTLSKLEPFINDVRGEGVTSILDTYGVSPLSISMTGEDSFFGSYVGYKPAKNSVALPKNLLTTSSFQKEYAMIKDLKAEGVMVDGELTEAPDAACIFAKGSSAISELYSENYYAAVYKYPTATNENMFNSMYAIGAYTQSAKRCMQVINYMQTDAELANILRYGVADLHYTYDKEANMVTVISDDWAINPEYAGNMFLTYQNTDMTKDELELSKDNWELAKAQNRAVIGSPYLGYSPITSEIYFENEDELTRFYFSDEKELNPKQLAKLTDEELRELDVTSCTRIMEEVKKASDEVEAKLAAFTGTGDELIAYMKTLGKEFESNPAVAAALSNKYSNSPFARYGAWYNITYPKDTSN